MSLSLTESLQRAMKHSKVKALRDVLIGGGMVVLLYFTLATFQNQNPPITFSEEFIKNSDNVSLAFAGDVILGRHLLDIQNDDSLLGDSDRIFRNVSLSTANLETAVLREDSKYEKDPGQSFYFSTPPSTLDKVFSIDVFNLANNHMRDYGEEGVISTLDTLDSLEISHTGAGRNLNDSFKLETKEINGVKIGILGFTDISVDTASTVDKAGPAGLNLKYVLPTVRMAAGMTDLLLVHVHWGEEYMTVPTTRQEEIAEALSNAGANVIIGHHPHVLQPVTMVNDTLVFYSLGNLVSDQGWSDTSETVVAVLDFNEKTRTATVILEPFKIRQGFPRLITNSYYRSKIVGKVTKHSNIEFEKTETGLLGVVDL